MISDIVNDILCLDPKKVNSSIKINNSTDNPTLRARVDDEHLHEQTRVAH